MYQSKLTDLLQAEVDRKDFIKYIGIAIIGAFGITAFLRNLHESVPAARKLAQPSKIASGGYGGSPYGR